MQCYICGVSNNAVEEHHVIPRSTGGELGPVVPLCANHHSLLHKAALQFVSKNPSNKQYFTDSEMLRARPLILKIVQSIRVSQSNPDFNQQVNLFLKPSRRLLTVLHVVKNDMGFSNLNDFCLWILTSYVKTKL
jgi:hypothetical protein